MKKKFVFVLIMILIIALTSCKGAGDIEGSGGAIPPEEMLPVGTVNVDLMAMGLQSAEDSDRLTELIDKLQIGIAANPDWLTDYVKEYEGKELPYHPNFGLSQEEYDEYLGLSDNIKLYKAADGVISIEKTDDEQYTISQKEGLRLIDNITIDLSNNTVSTNFGTCKYNGEIKASDQQIATGRWNGYSWILEDMSDASNYQSIQFNLGQMEDSKKIIMYYQVRMANGENRIDDLEVIQYPL
ncbi:hypothetical protein FRZ06_13665 [Anoxybacterium hadale]|uniref:Uncharacterized protein n=1 Tax=Anoxybacterium hadale TaxID=3408580 RepID=A0ACD1ADF4_9FIRM|nr:hypothetical protein FRZ06_13665 [Clostridiales bacterium]